ncbi:CtsR family transcriptional regulator [Hutsoniella sourekii]|uniref:CtsR family transcriptional regulator n=1 Tax=Hutsoniella sourekii TaxID=87650 RepID=UPI0004876CE0|nr:CtsR family transcriptional regulator [Hutsoniella sourekii]
MSKRNMSDIIEQYLKSFLQNQEQLEIKRSDIAERFDCVPSQINYVINTRFTQEHGYMVESKRGGGGYIRILKIELVGEVAAIDQMIELIGNRLNYRNAVNIIDTLYKNEIISQREALIMDAMLSSEVLGQAGAQEASLRANLLTQALEQLRIDYN